MAKVSSIVLDAMKIAYNAKELQLTAHPADTH